MSEKLSCVSALKLNRTPVIAPAYRRRAGTLLFPRYSRPPVDGDLPHNWPHSLGGDSHVPKNHSAVAVGGLLARQADGAQCGRLCGRAVNVARISSLSRTCCPG